MAEPGGSLRAGGLRRERWRDRGRDLGTNVVRNRALGAPGDWRGSIVVDDRLVRGATSESPLPARPLDGGVGVVGGRHLEQPSWAIRIRRFSPFGHGRGH